MSIFGTILSKIFHHNSAAPAPVGVVTAAPRPAPAPAPASAATAPTPATPAPTSVPAPAAPPKAVDVGAVLDQMAAQKGGGGNYRTSIVDLLKLLDMDSGLDARKQLAGELNVHAGADGTAEQNTALHRAVMQKLAENGGTIPANLRD